MRVLMGVPLALGALAALFVAARALQYASAESDAGLFVPSGANVVLRVHGLESHWGRIRGTAAWRAIERKLLRDPAVRGAINGLLGESGLPSLDDLEDDRRGGMFSGGRLFRAAGRDAVLALRAGNSWGGIPWCGATRLRLSDYLLVPFGGWILPSETVSGVKCLKVRRGKAEFLVAVQGRIAVVSSDRAFLAAALKGGGKRAPPARPILLRVGFDGSGALEDLRRKVRDWGFFALGNLESARGLEVTADVAGSSLRVDAVLEGAGPARPEPPPSSLAGYSPSYVSGFLLLGCGAREIHEWLKARSEKGGSPDFQAAFKALEDAGFASTFLPCVEPGMAVLLGSEEREGRLFPSAALLFPSRDPSAAVEAMSSVIQSRSLAGKQAEARLERRRVGDVEMMAWKWPSGLLLGPVPFNDVLRPCYAALPEAVVLGNNAAFTEAVIDRAAGRGEGLLDQGFYRRAMQVLRSHGLAAERLPAGIFILLPTLRESLDGLLRILAAWIVYGAQDGPRVRAEIDAELRRQGRAASNEEILEMFNAAMERRKQEQEESLRRSLRCLDAADWIAVQVAPAPEGLQVRLALEFR